MLVRCCYKIRAASGTRQGAGLLACLAVAALLAGCRNGPVEAGVDLFHDLEGGPIAAQRPPPPGVDDPYPNLGTIPVRPPAADVAAQGRVADQLAAQRDAARQAAAAAPLVAAPRPPPVPKPAAPDPNANSVTVDAAAAPPPPAPTPPPKPAGPAPLSPGIDSVPAVPASVASGPLPDFAAAPPARPAGIAVPAAVVSVAAPRQGVAAKPDNGVAVVFTPGSAVLPPSAPLSLRSFALAHKGAAITVTGHGDSVLPSADAQARALQLALQRAQAIAASLATAGVSASNLRVRAEAAGAGGSATL